MDLKNDILIKSQELNKFKKNRKRAVWSLFFLIVIIVIFIFLSYVFYDFISFKTFFSCLIKFLINTVYQIFMGINKI